MEGTLVDQDSTQVAFDNVLVDLERRLDEDSSVQVLGEASSQQKSQEHNTHPSERQKSSKQAEDSEQLEISEELEQIELNMSNPPILQTPLNEEKNPKRS